MVKLFGRFCDGMNKVYVCVGAFMMAVTAATAFLQVLMRFSGITLVVGTEELTRYAFIWSTMLGGSYCVSRYSNANVSAMGDILKGVPKKIHATMLDIFTLVAGVVLAAQGLQMVSMTLKQTSPMLGLVMGYVYIAIPLCGTGMVLNSINHILQRFLSKEEN